MNVESYHKFFIIVKKRLSLENTFYNKKIPGYINADVVFCSKALDSTLWEITSLHGLLSKQMIVSDLWFRSLKLGLEGKRAQFCSQKGA